jgi:hypothetical protein
MIALAFCYMYASNTHQESYQLFRFAKINSLDLAARTRRSDQEAPKPSVAAHGEMCMSTPTSTFGSIMLTTRHMAARALPQPWHASSCRLVALALVVRPVTASRGATTRRPDCTGSTTPMPCIRTRCLATRLLIGRSPWLSPCVRSLPLVARLHVVRIAPALLCLCHASRRAVSTLDFSSVGRTGSRHVPSHSVVRRDYLSRGRNGYTSPTPRVRVPRHLAQHVVRLVTRLVAPLVVDYFAYAARPGASARRAARHAARRAARRRLLRLRLASGCLGT